MKRKINSFKEWKKIDPFTFWGFVIITAIFFLINLLKYL